MNDSTPSQIKAAANKLFAEHGFKGTSVRDIAEAAGVNVSAINYHFGSKDGLFIEMMVEFGSGSFRSLFPILETPKTLEELRVRFDLFAREMIRLSFEDDTASRVILSHIELFIEMAPEAFQKSFMQIVLSLDAFFKGAQEQGVLKKNLDPSLITHIVFGALADSIRSSAIREKLKQPGLSNLDYREKFVQQITELVMTGVGEPNA